MIDLKPHNKSAYEKVKEKLKTNNRTCVVAPTGSGKSYIILQLMEDYINQGDIIVIEPTKYIFDQLKEKMEKYNIPGHNVKFLTYSALGKITDEKIGQFKNPKLVIVDEMHKAGAPVWGKGLQKMFTLFPSDCKYVGLSATPIRYLDGKRDMTKELFGGCVASEISLTDAILNRILPLPRYIAGLYTYDNEVDAITKKIQNSNNSEEEKQKLLEQLKTMKKNLDKSNGISNIFKKYLIENRGKYIAFCKDIKHLKEMKPYLEKWLEEGGIKANIYEVYSKNPEKNEQFQRFKEDDGLAVCMSISMLNEGIHGISGVILLRNVASPNLYYQQVGRVFQVNMNCVPIIFDLVANCKSVIDCTLRDDLLKAVNKREKKKADGHGDGDGIDEITREDIEQFFIFDQVMDAVSMFRGIEEKLEGRWSANIQALRQYREREGDCLVPDKHVELMDDGIKVSLGRWVQNIRKAKKGKLNYILTNERKTQLDELGFIWDVNDYNFNLNFRALKQYREREGGCLVPDGHVEVVDNEIKVSLGRWVMNMRSAKKGKGSCLLTKERIAQLDELGFIWDVEKHNFIKKVNEIIDFYNKNNRLPSRCKESEKEYGFFISKYRNKKQLPDWKRDMLKQIPHFFNENLSMFDNFYNHAVMYKKQFGHLDIIYRDVLNDGYRIGANYNSIKTNYRNGKLKLTDEQLKKLDDIGIDIIKSEHEKRFNKNMQLARQALAEGIVIDYKNPKYKGVNLYDWINHHKNEFTKDELNTINQIIPNRKETPVKVIDVDNNTWKIYCSMREAGRALCNEFYVVTKEDAGHTAISRHLTGRVKNPIYKGRFKFEYADKEINNPS